MRSNIDLSSIKSSQVDHLPIISHYAKQMGFEKIINELVPTEMEVKPGKIVLGMVIDILSGRSPLDQLEIIFNEMDCELLLGEDLPDGYFNDDNVGRVLKHIYEAGTQKIFSSLSMAVVNAFSLPTDQVHFDTTSISLFGQYLNSQKEGSPFEINHGYSKDKRPLSFFKKENSLFCHFCVLVVIFLLWVKLIVVTHLIRLLTIIYSVIYQNR